MRVEKSFCRLCFGFCGMDVTIGDDGRVQSVTPDRDNPATADTLGWILFKSGADRAEGLALLERAARGAPSDDEIRERLERARRG